MMLSNVRDMLRSPVTFLRDLSDKNDGVAELRMPGKTIWVLSHPQAVKHVLQDRNKNFVRGTTLGLIAPVFGRGLATSDGEHWLKHRRMMQPAFHKERMRKLAEEMDEEITQAVAQLPKTVEARQAMVAITQRVVVRTMFGTALGSEAGRFGDALLAIERHIGAHAFDVIQRPLWLPTPDNLTYKRAVKTLNTLVYRMIHEHKGGGDLLDMLIAASDPDAPGDRMSAEDVRDEVMTIFIAGHETTANTLAFALYSLGKNPDARRLLEAEVRAATDVSPASLPYTRAVIEETLRLYPPAWIFAREPVEADEIMGRRVLPGSLVLICAYAAHRRTDVFPEPDAFRPERFAGTQERPPFSYFPFGGGPHLCIGNHFAMAESLLVLARLFQRFDVQMTSGALSPVPSMTLGLDGPVDLTLVDRAS